MKALLAEVFWADTDTQREQLDVPDSQKILMAGYVALFMIIAMYLLTIL